MRLKLYNETFRYNNGNIFLSLFHYKISQCRLVKTKFYKLLISNYVSLYATLFVTFMSAA